ncbi:MAG: hypothetical protein U0R70_06325 [Solirubrobacteraceae bacterium]
MKFGSRVLIAGIALASALCGSAQAEITAKRVKLATGTQGEVSRKGRSGIGFLWPGGELGGSVAGLGDVNGDGIGDVGVSAPFADANSKFAAGVAYVLYGPVTGPLDLGAPPAGRGYRIFGVREAGAAGGGIGAAGDVNGDGIGDLLVEETGTITTHVGFTHVVFGAKTSGNLNVNGLRGRGFTIRETQAGGEIGAALGDLNGDGRGDFYKGARFVAGRSAAGDVFASSGAKLTGVEEGQRVTAAPAGDVNGDGRNDAIFGVRSALAAEPNRAVVIFGAAGLKTFDLTSPGPGGFVIRGKKGDDDFAESVAGAGDVNGDGKADVIIGNAHPLTAIRTDATLPKEDLDRSGGAVVVFGAAAGPAVEADDPGARGFRILPGPSDRLAGAAVTGLGDVDGDGRSEVAVGIPGSTASGAAGVRGSVAVVFGRAGTSSVKLGKLGDGGLRVPGARGPGAFGTALGAADVNGDGVRDVLVGAPDEQAGSDAGAGAAYAIVLKSRPTCEGKAAQFTVLGKGTDAWTMVDSDGISHIAWVSGQFPDTRLNHRRQLPGCGLGKDTVFPDEPGSFQDPRIVEDTKNDRLLLFYTLGFPIPVDKQGLWVAVSRNGGASFEPGRHVIPPPGDDEHPGWLFAGINRALPAQGVSPVDGSVWSLTDQTGLPAFQLSAAFAPLTATGTLSEKIASRLRVSAMVDRAGIPYFGFQAAATPYVHVGAKPNGAGADYDVPIGNPTDDGGQVGFAAGKRGVVAATVARDASRNQRLELWSVGPDRKAVRRGAGTTLADTDTVVFPSVGQRPGGAFDAVFEGRNSDTWLLPLSGSGAPATAPLVVNSLIPGTPGHELRFQPVAGLSDDGAGWVVGIDGRDHVVAVSVGGAVPPPAGAGIASGPARYQAGTPTASGCVPVRARSRVAARGAVQVRQGTRVVARRTLNLKAGRTLNACLKLSVSRRSVQGKRLTLSVQSTVGRTRFPVGTGKLRG